MPVDVSNHEYELLVKTSAGVVTVPFMGLSYDDDEAEVGIKIRAQVPDQATDEWDPAYVALPSSFVLNGGPPDDPVEICRGILLGEGFGMTSGTPITPRGYSLMYAMLHSRIDCHYSDHQTGSAIMADLCGQWSIPVDVIEGPGVDVTPLHGRRKQIADIFKTILARAKMAGDGSYVMKWGPNGFQCVRPGKNKVVYWFVDGESILGGAVDSSAEKLVTRVKVYEPVNDTTAVTVKRDAQGRFVSLEGGQKITVPQEMASVDGHTEFGIFQDVVYAKKGDDATAAMATAQGQLQANGQPTTTIDVEIPLLADIGKGDRHHITGGPIDTYGYVTGLSADVGTRTMRLTMAVEWTDAFTSADTDTQEASDTTSTTADVSNSGSRQYNQSTPPVLQTSGWSCSCASMAWALQSMGVQASEQDVIAALGPSGVNDSSGLLDASGQHLASVVQQKYGVNARASAVTFDQVLSMAGQTAITIGGVGWDHWTGVAGAQGDSLVLANPAPNYGGSIMTRDQFAARGPFYAVRLDPTNQTA